MKSNQYWGRVVALAASLLLVAGGAAFAQLQTGNVYGKVVDQQGAALPGVTVTLDTGAAQEVQVTNAQGEFRFLSLPPATMKLKSELQGFGTVEYPNVVVTVGHNTTLEITMNSAVEDVITVTTESPLLDERKISTGATVNATELAEIPTSRDPWTILSTTPGVLVDRVNVGGNESGQQSTYVGPGSFGGNSVWAVDGVTITDMSALGSSPSYYDFDAFQEMQVTTGGSDSTLATGGVVINMVTKRGTNQWRGSARYYDTPGALESQTSFNDNQLPGNQKTPRTANEINKVTDWGAEVGGPIIRDRLWFWGAYGDQKADITAFGGATTKADLPTWNGKVNAQLASSNSLTLFVLNNAKTVAGRGASSTRPQETTWNQGHQGQDPSADKAEDTQIFGPNFYLTGLYSNVNGGFGLVPEGGIGPTVYRDPSFVWHNSYADYQTVRPQHQFKLDASTFFNVGNVSNELKYGAGYRRVETDSLSTWGPTGWIDGIQGPGGVNLFIAAREENLRIRDEYTSAYAQDTLTAGNLTANVGVRFDRQKPTNLSSTVPANAADPVLLPAFNYAGGPGGFTWSDVTPRLGLTYALGKERKTLLRASYSRFADQLGSAFSGILNPTAAQSYYYFYTPQIGPGVPTIFTPAGFGYSGNVNPLTSQPFPTNSNLVAKNFSAPLTDEVLASVEHAILPELVVSLNLTWRHLTNQLPGDVGPTGLPAGTAGAGELLVFDTSNPFDPSTFNSAGRVATRNDFIPTTTTVTLPNGQKQTLTYYVLRPGVSTRNGTFLTNGGADSTYKGASLNLNKRLSNHWMMRGNFTYSDWKYGNPTDTPDPTEFLPGGNRNGDAVLVAAGGGSGPKEFVFINSKWSGSLNGMYQVAPDRPWGFNLAGNFTTRQGYALPYYVQVNMPSNYAGGVHEDIMVGRPDAQRLPDLYTFDARIEKELTFQDFGLTLSFDVFNLFNSSTITQRVTTLDIAAGATNGPNYVYEILAPRVYRFGARISFR